MLIAVCTTALLAFAMAIIPVFPVETYVIAMAAAADRWAVPIGIAAGIGQALGKLVVFLGTRGAIKSAWTKRLVDRWSKPSSSSAGRFIKRVAAAMDRPILAAPIVLLSAGTGIPPLVIVAFYAARTRMSWVLFLLLVLIGRCVWFVAIALVPSLFTN